eukprot:CAMPEP_0180547862 /NCGR_PEP_ID=MMETSP1036_2-20121128/71312_1 /TAXON_ID=632150 /ORGANISM="Azadinium spinosum, Strain 3D9" /LENGTH=77 /DNA_ID=CAMNT_0022563025 /DNA_START=808 /DNA_END=1038 /DNA_ORIENTATION=-
MVSQTSLAEARNEREAGMTSRCGPTTSFISLNSLVSTNRRNLFFLASLAVEEQDGGASTPSLLRAGRCGALPRATCV